jgi:hypothetical protein
LAPLMRMWQTPCSTRRARFPSRVLALPLPELALFCQLPWRRPGTLQQLLN